MFIRKVLKLLCKLMPGYFLSIPKKLVKATFKTPSFMFCNIQLFNGLTST